jgi:hypothetical protein
MSRRINAITGLLLILLTAAAIAAPRPEAWEHWTAHDNRSRLVVDHAEWDAWLKRNAVRPGPHGSPGGVRYGGVSTADRERLESYIATLQTLPISRYSRAEQKAYWINLYNALTVKLVLDHYPVQSVVNINISPGLLSRGPWDRKMLVVEGEDISLNDIEHRILRPIWRDPLVHYGLNNASAGCPSLATEAFTGANTERLLLANARAFVNSPRGVRIRDGRLTVSSLYDWYMADFGGTDGSVIAHLKSLAAPALLRQLSLVTRIGRHQYDWSLNDAGPGAHHSAGGVRPASKPSPRTAPAAR